MTVGVLGVLSPLESSKPFLFRGDYFGENLFLLGETMSLETFVAIRETSSCIISKKLYDNIEIFGPARSRMIIDNTFTLSKAVISTDCTNDNVYWRSTPLIAASMDKDDIAIGPACADMIREDVYILGKAVISTDFIKGTHSSTSDDSSNASEGSAKEFTSSCPCPTFCSCLCLVFSSFWDTIFPQKN